MYIKNIENPYFIFNIFKRVCTLMFFSRGSIFYNYIYCSIYAGWTVRAFHTSPRGSPPPATLLYVFPWCIAALVFAVMHGQSTIMVTWTSGRAVGGGYYKYHSLSVMFSHFGVDKSWSELCGNGVWRDLIWLDKTILCSSSYLFDRRYLYLQHHIQLTSSA